MSRIFEVTDKVRSHDPRADVDMINRAYVFAANAHANQKRSSGEPYLAHPLAVANILASLRLDDKSIVTGLLHDTVEDTAVTLEDIEDRFGGEVASLVDGVTKIGQIRFTSSEHKQAENFRKMILATAKDLRVLLVKLADRLHNMRTLGFLPNRKRRLIAMETMELYAPLAHRLGIHWLTQELEDHSFSHLEPEAHADLASKLAVHLEGLNQTREHLEAILQEAVNRQGCPASVQGRMKHMYSLFLKMQRKQLDFDDVYDLVAFRVIVEDIPACYQTLGIIHSMYRPVPGRFKDYIALPKPNGYQSLHTSIIGPDNYRLEVQIRTEAMHRYAEDGIAAHWLYKSEGLDARDEQNFKWLKQLTELLKDSDQPGEFLENVRLDLFVKEVYVFSRDGDLFALPRGALPLDFAYAVHTDIGHHCMGVRINGQPADFETRLRNGDQIEVLTDPEQTPSRHWVQHVRTPRARQAIRSWFRREERDASVRVGEEIVFEVFGRKKKVSKDILATFDCSDMDDLKVKLGRGEVPLDQLLAAANRDTPRLLRLKGNEQGLIRAAKCCRPLPGDAVFGHFEHGHGMIVHHQECAVAASEEGETWMNVEWKPEEGKLYKTSLDVSTLNRHGMLASVSGAIAKLEAGIVDLSIHQLAGEMTTLNVLVEVRDRVHLAKLIRGLLAVEDVVKVRRNIKQRQLEKVSRRIGRRLRSMMGRPTDDENGIKE